MKVKIGGYGCERCGHMWTPRSKDPPRYCLKCKSYYYDRPKKKVK